MMTVSLGDFNSYLIPRQVIRGDIKAAMQLIRNKAGDKIQSVFWVSHCFLICGQRPEKASSTAFSRSHDFPTLNNETSSITANASQTLKPFSLLKTTIRKAQ